MKTELFLREQEDQSLLVIVDMIQGFVCHGALADPRIHAITPKLLSTINEYEKRRFPIIAFRAVHPATAREFASFPAHCVEGSEECELIEELKPLSGHWFDLKKNSTNGFFQPDFLPLFQSFSSLRSVLITGCCTDICVLQFALSLKAYLNQNDLDIEVLVAADQVATYDSPIHPANDYHNWALKLMANAGIRILNSCQWED